MIPYIDGDILLYEIGYCGEFKDENDNIQIREFEFVKELLDQRIKEICEAVMNTLPPMVFFTSSEKFSKLCNMKWPDDDYVHKDNFRIELATKKGYKGQRKQEKPFHYWNLAAYIFSNYSVAIIPGVEADDAMAIYQSGNTIICSRDKDLMQVPGWHYSWPCGKQLAVGPIEVDELGWLEMKMGNKLKGVGLKWFYAQVMMGDNVDNVPGLKGYGPVKTYNLLHDCENEKQLFEVVQTAYMTVYGEDWYKEMQEQINLVWMIRELDENNNPIKHVMYCDRV